MKRLTKIAMILSLGAFFAASAGTFQVSAGQDDLRSEVRNVSGFTGVDIGGAMEATITVGGAYSVVIEAKPDVLPKIKTEVKGSSLVVGFEREEKGKFNWKKRGKVRVLVSLPSLDDLDISGATSATVTGVSSDSIDIDVSGASTVSIDGTVRTANIDVSGASNLKAAAFTSDSADIDASGASSVKLNVTSELRADASGASSVCYGGNPRVQKDTSGASSVKGGCGQMIP